MDMQFTGIITKATGGFYYVTRPDGQVVECRARGLFRKDNFTPYVGDVADCQAVGESGYITGIHPRKNWLIRPPLANLDQLLLVLSVSDPAPNLLVTDTLICIAEHKDIRPIVVITKPDLAEPDSLAQLYQEAGFPILMVNNLTGEGVKAVADILKGCISAFAGNSGVGKSSLLNQVDPRLGLEVGETSKKLGRGRHTTRHVEIFTLENGGMIADTPGFSAIDPVKMGSIPKEELAGCFREFADYSGKCRFSDCSHTVEKGCAILEAVENGEIARSRHESYQALYQNAKDNKPY